MNANPKETKRLNEVLYLFGLKQDKNCGPKEWVVVDTEKLDEHTDESKIYIRKRTFMEDDEEFTEEDFFSLSKESLAGDDWDADKAEHQIQEEEQV